VARPGPTRCNECREPFRWFRFGGSFRKFDPTPVDPHRHAGPPAHPVEGTRAWGIQALVEELQGRRGVSEDEARDEAYDMPWHVLHTCPPTTEENGT
jgi:hypothetical protein